MCSRSRLNKRFKTWCAAWSLLMVVASSTAQAAWDAVPTVSWSTLRPSDFRDDELDIPFFLDHFHELVDGIQETGPERGFINIRVWRGQEQQRSYNARVMESY